jgi:hypothetical protein
MNLHYFVLLNRVPSNTGLSLSQGVGYTATSPVAPDLASLFRRALVLSCVTWLQTSSPCSEGLWCYHVPRSSRPCLPAREDSGAVMCPVDPDPASLLERALTLPRAPRLRTPPPCLRGLRHNHILRGSLKVTCRGSQE